MTRRVARKPYYGTVYVIQNMATGMVYVGGSVRCNDRRRSHFGLLRNSKHYNKHLQQDWDKYGEAVFDFVEIEDCENDNLKDKELEYIILFEQFCGVYNKQGAVGIDTPQPQQVHKDDMWYIENPEPIRYSPPHNVYRAWNSTDPEDDDYF